MTETTINQFVQNYNGILTHDGWVKVAEGNVKQKILHLNKDNVLVKGRRNSYTCSIHVELYPLIRFITPGDIGLIKFRNGCGWLVGFHKKNNGS